MSVTFPFRVRLAMGNLRHQLGKMQTTADAFAAPLEHRAALKPSWWMLRKLPTDVRIDDRQIPGRGGSIRVRVYTPEQPNGRGLVYFHGGGFAVGSVEACHHLCVDLASVTGDTIVSVDYRLAPEAPFPAGLDDCEDALRWTVGSAQTLGITPGPIAVGGDSAGGNLAAALCLRLKRSDDDLVSRQVLIYPILDLTCSAQSWVTEAQSYESGARARQLLQDCYLGDVDAHDPLASPLFAPDLSGLPPALLITAQHDTLRDDGLAYAERLRAAGVPTRYSDYARMPHGFFSQPRLASSYDHGIGEVAAFLDQG